MKEDIAFYPLSLKIMYLMQKPYWDHKFIFPIKSMWQCQLYNAIKSAQHFQDNSIQNIK